MAERSGTGPGSRDPGSFHSEIRLTPREQQVLEMLSQGRPNKQIAGALFLSEDTVKFHLKRLYRKLGARSRLEAVAMNSKRRPSDSSPSEGTALRVAR